MLDFQKAENKASKKSLSVKKDICGIVCSLLLKSKIFLLNIIFKVDLHVTHVILVSNGRQNLEKRRKEQNMAKNSDRTCNNSYAKYYTKRQRPE